VWIRRERAGLVEHRDRAAPVLLDLPPLCGISQLQRGIV
jgi:hypothetical protein